MSKLQALQDNYKPPRGLIEDFQYVFPCVVALTRPFFFAVVFVNFFPDNLASEREKKKKIPHLLAPTANKSSTVFN